MISENLFLNNMENVKLGVVVGSADWLLEELAVICRKELIAAYSNQYDNSLYECPICLTDNEVSLRRVIKDLRKAECNALCIYYANYGPESVGSMLIKEFDGPVMVIAAAEEGDESVWKERKDAVSGFINACYSNSLRGANTYIPVNPIGTKSYCAQLIYEFLPIARTLLAINDLKIISFSPRPSSYTASYAPVHGLLERGIEVAEYSELELYNSFIRHEGDRRIDRIISEMMEELGEDGTEKKEILTKLAQYEITITDWIKTHKGSKSFVSLTSTCWPAFPVSFGFVPCYVNSRLTGKGIPVACEVDVFGALSEYIGQCISGDQVAILNINNNITESTYLSKISGKRFNNRVYKQSDLFLGYHCGVTCSEKLVSCRMEPHFVNNQLIGEEHSMGTIHGQVVSGQITLFRIHTDKRGRLKAYVAQGQILPVEVDTYGGYAVIAVPEFERFFRNVIIDGNYPNHTTVVFGHHARALTDVAKYMGIERVDYNHPIDQPYKNENRWDILNDWY